MDRITVIRVILVCLLISSTGFIAYSWQTADVRNRQSLYERAYHSNPSEPVVPPSNGTTVVTTARRWQSDVEAAIVAFEPDGTVAYYNNSHYLYQDVDPLPNQSADLFLLTANPQKKSKCPSGTQTCSLNGFYRIRIEEEGLRHVYTEQSSNPDPDGSMNWHDADQINSTHYVVADIARDRVFIVDVRTGQKTWMWNASAAYNRSSGGSYPGDWTHINDVEVLPDGRIMASLRNQDSVVFIEPGEGLQENWTLGSDNNHSVLFGQHNPDYVPASRGGPAVLLADSENNRVVEYQRVNGSWKLSWAWSDSQLQWPRDADRLPNGHTLIVDSNGGRVLEVDENGEIVWSMAISLPYDAERLGTGDESAGGYSARALGLESRVEATTSGRPALREKIIFEQKRELLLRSILTQIIPHRTVSLVVSGLLFVTPAWVLVPELIAIVVGVLSTLSWIVLELVARYGVPSVLPRRFSLR